MTRKRRTPLIVGILLAVGAVGAFLWNQERDGESPIESTPSTAEGISRHGGDPLQPTEPTEVPSVRASITTPAGVHLVRAVVREAPESIFGAFSGRVLSVGSGRPVQDAELSFSNGESTETVRSEPNGQFTFEARAASEYQLAFATADGYLPYAPEWGHSPIIFRATPGRQIDGAVIYLTPAIDYIGRVTHDGTPVPDATAEVFDSGHGALGGEATNWTTDEHGEFRFHARDGATVRAEHPRFGAVLGRIDIGVQISRRLELEFQLDAPPPPVRRGLIAGRIVDSDGEPLGDALVIAECIRSAVVRAHEPGVSRTVVTTAEGAFSINDLEPCSYQVTASLRPFVPARVQNISLDTTDLTLTLRRGDMLRGRVVNMITGEPVPSFVVVVQEALGAVERVVIAMEAVYDAGGQFEVPGIPRGEYFVYVAASGYAASNSIATSVPEDELLVELGAGATLRGVVVSRTNEAPIAGAVVSLEGALGVDSGVIPILANDATDEDGAFELIGIPPGRQSITVAAEGHHARMISGLYVDASNPLAITIDLAPVAEDETPALELVGIGVILTPEGDELVIGEVLAGGGGAEVGLAPGDVILAVDGHPIEELGFNGSIQMIRGPEGSSVQLLIRRVNSATEEVVSVPRRRLRA